MEIIQFSNNVEFAEKARELLEAPEGYPYAFDSMRQACLYRLHNNEEVRRCIIGRMMYGHIPEDHSFWMDEGWVNFIITKYPIFKEKFPWLNKNVAMMIQSIHDLRAMRQGDCQYDGTVCNWDEVLEAAREADKKIPS